MQTQLDLDIDITTTIEFRQRRALMCSHVLGDFRLGFEM